jgi:type I restriction enzyme S subunit
MSNTNFKIDKSTWKTVKFGDVVFEPKEVCKDIFSEGIEHVVGLEHIESGNIHLRKSETTEENTTFSKKFLKGDVLFGRRRAYLKKAAQANFNGICSGDITVFRANNELLSDLLPFVVSNDKFFDYAVKHSAGGLSPRVKFKDLANFEFLLPPFGEQKRLSELLWAMDQVIEMESKTLELLEKYRKSKIKQLLLNDIESKCEMVKLKDVFFKINKKNKSLESSNVLTISAQFGLVNQKKYFNRSVSSKDLTNYYLIQNGDFAYNKSYSDGYPAGAIKVLELYNDGVVSPLYICFRSNCSQYHSAYYKHLFEFGYLNKQILSIAKEGARNHGLLNVSSTDFFELLVPMPSELTIKKILPLIDKISETKTVIKKKLLATQSFQKSIINKLF